MCFGIKNLKRGTYLANPRCDGDGDSDSDGVGVRRDHELTMSSTIIDFELWNETKDTISDEKTELQRWGLERRPPPKDWWAEWSLHMR
jgi:hypothetical protein